MYSRRKAICSNQQGTLISKVGAGLFLSVGREKAFAWLALLLRAQTALVRGTRFVDKYNCDEEEEERKQRSMSGN